MPSELPDNLKSLAAGLDALAGRASASPEVDSLPTLDGTDFEPFAELGRGGKRLVARHVQDDRIGRPRACGEREEDDDGKGEVKFSHNDCILQYPLSPVNCKPRRRWGASA